WAETLRLPLRRRGADRYRPPIRRARADERPPAAPAARQPVPRDSGAARRTGIGRPRHRRGAIMARANVLPACARWYRRRLRVAGVPLGLWTRWGRRDRSQPRPVTRRCRRGILIASPPVAPTGGLLRPVPASWRAGQERSSRRVA